MNIQTKQITLTSHSDIVDCLKKKKIRISSWAEEIIEKISFTDGITYTIAIIKGEEIGKDYFTTQEIRDEAQKRGYTIPHPEVGLLLREKFSDVEIEQMGLWYIVTMHEPIKDSVSGPGLLGAHRGDGGLWLGACYGRPDDGWSREGGFAFAVSQVGTQDLGPQPSLVTLNLEQAIGICKNAGYQVSKIL